MDSTIPIPRVAGPKISAPPASRSWDAIIPPPVPPSAQEPGYAAVLDHAGTVLPKLGLDAFWGAVKSINKVVFRSTPPNAPVPEREGSWKFAALGDYGGGHSPQDEIARNVAAGRPDLLVTLGDNVYFNGLESEFQKKWDPPQWFGDLRRNIPVLPSLGNHDVRREPDGVPYFQRFPELKEARFYSFEHKGVHFVALNSTESLEPGTPQYDWLERDLASSTKDWNVLYFHHPLYASSIGGDGPNKTYLAPLMAKYGVDLVLTGHEHNYQRSKPLNEQGTIEVISGGGGQSLHPFRRAMPSWTAYRDVDFGHVEVEVDDDQLVGRYVVRDGSVRDTFVIPNATPWRGSNDAVAGAATTAQRSPSV